VPSQVAAVPNAFDFSVSPFNCLTTDQQRLVRASVDIDYVPEGQTMLAPGEAPTHLFVLIKGFVQQWDGDELVATLGSGECFDGRALVAGRASHRFVAVEEVLAYRLAKAAVAELIAANATFGALLFADLSKKLSALAAQHDDRELRSLTLARVDQAVVRPAHEVDGSTDVVSVVRLFTRERTTHVLVRDTDAQGGVRLGIFTTAGLQRAILAGTPLDRLPVGTLASYPLVTVPSSAPLYDALATMIHHRVQRVVVTGEGGAVVGILEQLDLLSFLSNQSYLVIRKIIEADDLGALRDAAAQITRMMSLLHRGGTRVTQIARLVRELNAKLFERAWQLVAPAELVANSCLFVMGSEGRGEQLLKTDQDNGLVLRDGWTPPPDLASICDRFSAALAEFGYPECPGRIMVSNPEWRRPAAEFGQTVRRWLLMPSAESLMALAIFVDAQAVCGDAALLEHVRDQVFALVGGNDALLARFAAAINAFETGTGWWNRIFTGEDEHRLDLKKAGLFPIVHGVRALALAHGVRATATDERVDALVAAGAIDAPLGAALVDSLHFLMDLKLRQGLLLIDKGQTPADNRIALDRLASLDRDLLKDTLGVVKRFRALLRQRFHLDAL
jgi:CBS domain-containing protein